LALEVKNIWKLNNVPIYTSVISAAVMVNKNLLKYPENVRLTKNILRVWQKAVLLHAGYMVGRLVIW